MKQVFTTVLFLFIVQHGWSQMDMKLKPRLYNQNTDSLTVKRPPYFINNSRLLNSDNARFSHPVAAGSVYTLPQDNMPCLKPDTTLFYGMPVQKVPADGIMPNAYQQSDKELLQSLRKQFQRDKK